MTEFKEEPLDEMTKKVYEQMCRTIGVYINHVREKKSISLREMYRRTNISIAVLSDIENGQKLPRFETLIKLVFALDIPLSYIFGSKCCPEHTFSNIKPHERLKDKIIKSPFWGFDFSKDEIKEITDFIEYIEFKRNKKK